MVDEREQGREAYRRRAWDAAYQSLSLADLAAPLGAEDLERLATSAYLTGRDADFHRIADRAHHAHLQAGSPERAARSAFWLGLGLLLRGESAIRWKSASRPVRYADVANRSRSSAPNGAARSARESDW